MGRLCEAYCEFVSRASSSILDVIRPALHASSMIFAPTDNQRKDFFRKWVHVFGHEHIAVTCRQDKLIGELNVRHCWFYFANIDNSDPPFLHL